MQVPKHVLRELKRRHPTISILWSGQTSQWILMQETGGAAHFVHAFSGLPTMANTVKVLDKEAAPARHQSGRNSGVIHSGIYYPPGSLKALLCAAGRRSMEAYARDHGIPVEITGKLIVATRIEEIDRLDALAERGRAHGLTVRPMSPAEAAEVEPHIGCVAALHVAETGVVDFPAVCAQLARDVVELGGEVRTGCRVTAMATVPGGQRVTTTSGEIRTRRLVNCGGLQSDLLAAAAGVEVPGRIIAFRGEYRDLVASARPLAIR